MQTKATIFFLSVTIYLVGLILYSNSRALAQTRIDGSLARTAPVAAEIDELANSIDLLKRKRRARISAPLPEASSPEVNVADQLIVDTIRAFNSEISKENARELAALIEKSATRYDVDPLLVTALVSQESAFFVDAVSPVGAIGLGQLMPYTAADLGVDPNNPQENLDGCVRYLAQNLDAWAQADDPISLALASYNAGPGAVASYGGIPPYEETRNYVAVITARYDRLRERTVAG